MSDLTLLGTKVRALRRKETMTQAELAKRLGVSPSYLNLIESNRRPLPASMLIQLAEIFQLDLQSFAASEDARLMSDLMEVFGDPLFENHGLTTADVRELSVVTPAMGRAVLGLYRAYQGVRESMETLTSRVSDGEGDLSLDRSRLPSEEVSDFIQRHLNHFPDLEEAAEALRRDARLDGDDVYPGLCRYLEEVDDIKVRIAQVGEDRGTMRRYDPDKKLLTLSELLRPRSRNFQLAHQVGLLVHSSILDQLARDPHLTTDESRALCRVALANYFAAAVLMPYAPFLATARSERYDIELLGHRFRTSFEQVCHRLTSLRRPNAQGVPFHLLRVDIAGNVSKRFSASGIRFARFGGACPRWNAHAAFLTPGMIRVQVSKMPDGTAYFCVASILRKDSGGYHATHPIQAIALGCEVSYAKELVYSDGVDVVNEEGAVPVGLTCRLCERMDCEQRAFPALHQNLRIQENVRGLSFYAPGPASDSAQRSGAPSASIDNAPSGEAGAQCKRSIRKDDSGS